MPLSPAPMAPIEYHADRRKYVGYLLVSLAFVAAGVWGASTGGGWVLWACAAFFGVCAAAFVVQLRQSGPRLTIDDDGLWDRTLGVGVIRWADVLDARPTSSGGQPFVSLDLRDPEVYLDRLDPLRRKLAGVNKVAGFSELSLNLGGLRGADAVEIAEIIRARSSGGRRG